MSTRRKTVVAVLVVLGLAAGAVSVANAVGGDDGDEQATGPAAEQAKAAALRIVPGTANAVERDDEKGATWEVEVRKPDGSTVDVRLDADYKKVAVDSDSEDSDDSGTEGSDDGGE